MIRLNQGGTITLLSADSGVVPAGSYFVAADGTNTWSGCQNNPNNGCSWQTAMANAVAGDAVYFRGGTYNIDRSGAAWDNPAMRPANNGTSVTNRIWFIAYPSEIPYIIGSDGSTDELDATAFGCGTGDAYITWDGFHGELSDSAQFNATTGYNTNMLFGLYGCTGCVATNFHMYGVVNGNPSSGGNTCPMFMDTATECTISNSIIEGNTGGGVNTACIWTFRVSSCVVTHCELKGSQNGLMQKFGPNNGNSYILNYIHDIEHDGIYMNEQTTTATGGNVVQENLLVNIGWDAFFLGGTFALPNYSIHHNTGYNVRTAVAYELGSPSATNLIFRDNIFVTTDQTGTYFDSSSLPSTLNHNCYYHTAGYIWNTDYANSYTSIAAWRGAVSDEANSIEANPVFVNAGGANATDYALDTGSPCIGTGSSGSDMGITLINFVGPL